jgi:MtrB/PioB family decaheme-associated outer membrane protein
LALAPLLTPAVRAQVDTSDWACNYCPFEEGQRAEIAAGATTVEEDSAYFGDATGYDEEGVYANVDGAGTYASEGFRLRWDVEDLGLDSRAVAIEGGRPGSFDFNLGYRELPRRQFDTSESVYTLSARDTLLLPPGWVRSGLTTGMTQLAPNLAPYPIQSDRSVFDIGAGFAAAGRWRFAADFRRQERDGTRISGGSAFVQANLLPLPFDYVTDEVDFGVRYSMDNGFVAIGWYLSEFESEFESVTWEQPYTFDPAIGNDTYRLAQPPDSRLQQLSLRAGYSWPAQKTVLSLTAATGEIEQDSSLLPYTITSSITTSPLPRTSLDADVDTTQLALSVTSRIIDKARIKIGYRYDERDNRTTQDLWNRVIVDTFASSDLEANIPYSFERSTLTASADYDLFDTVRVSGGYERRDIDRNFQEVTAQTEDTGWGRLRWRPTAALELDIKGGASERDFDEYDEAFAASLGQNPLLRKYHLAYRYREFGEITMAFSPPEIRVAATLNALYADDSYTKSELGILSGDEFRLVADVSWWSESGDVAAYVNAGIEDIESLQAGSETFATPDWLATHDDDFTTIGAGVHWRNIGEADKFDLLFDYLRSDGGSEIIVDSVADGPSEFPELTSTLDYLRLKLNYRFSARLEMNLNLRYQRFVAEDWALEDVEPATIPLLLSLGAEPYSPEIYVVGIGFRYKMGGDDDQ